MRSILFASLLLLLCIASVPVGAAPAHRVPVVTGTSQTHQFLPMPRKVFWKGVMTLKVPNFEAARHEALQLAAAHQGSSYSQEVASAKNGRQHGVVYIRVPEAERGSFLDDAHRLGMLYSEKISAPDVSEEYVDLGRRQRNLLAEEDQLLQILKQAHHVLEVLQVQGHLFNVRVECEQVTSRLNEIDLKSDTALFAINLFEAPAVEAPTSPGGPAQFLPRWWQYTASPLLKQQVHATWYTSTTALLNYLTGLEGNIPNVAWLVVYVLSALAFWRFAWPAFRPQLKGMLSTLQASDMPWRTVGSGLVCVGAAHAFLPDTITVVLFSLVVVIMWRQFSQTESGVRLLHSLSNRGVEERHVYLAVSLPLALSVTQAVAPDVWTTYGTMLLHSLFLVALVLFVPSAVRRVREAVQGRIKAHLPAPVVGMTPEAQSAG